MFSVQSCYGVGVLHSDNQLGVGSDNRLGVGSLEMLFDGSALECQNKIISMH